MRKTYQILPAILLVLTFFSCNSESPFSGTDNRILSLNLIASGQEYKGVLTSENTIEIITPIELDLNNAKANYIISEQARILPDPAKINDWNNEQVFNVISYSGDKRTYIVHIIRQKEIASNDVLLATDAEVKAFAEKGISRVGGNLIIGRETGADSISNIDALTYLTKVDYEIIINPTYKGRDLSGLRNVSEVGGLRVNGNKFLKNITLKSLQTVYEDFIINSDTLREIALPTLTEVRGSVSIKTNNVTGIDFPKLKKTGSFSVKGNKQSSVKMKLLEEVSGNFTLDNLPALERVDVSKLQHIAGDLKITNLALLGTLTFPVLKTVDNNLTLENSPGIAEFYLPSLERAKGFRIYNNTKLSRIMAPKTKEVDGDFVLYGCPIKNIDQLAVETVNGMLGLSNLTSLQSIGSFFKSVKKAKKIELNFLLVSGALDLSGITFDDLNLINCSNLTEIILPQELNSLELKGNHTFRQKTVPVIKGLKKVTDFSILDIVTKEVLDYQLPDLEAVENNFSIRLANVKSIIAPKLKSVKNQFSIPLLTNVYQYNHAGEVSVKSVVCPSLEATNLLYVDSPDLETIDFPKLTTLDQLRIVSNYPVNNNSKLKNLTGLKVLKQVRSIETRNLKEFTDYSFLKLAVENGSLKEVKASLNKYNPTLDDLKAGKYIQP